MEEPPSDRPDIAALYAQYRPLLLLIAARRFGVERDEAEDLVHDVFVSYLRRWRVVRDVRRWLIGAICHACRYRERKFGRLDQFDLPEHDIPSSPTHTDRPVAQQLVERLSQRDQELLAWRFIEGMTAAEIGVLLGCTPKAADKRLRRALKHAAGPPRGPKPRK